MTHIHAQIKFRRGIMGEEEEEEEDGTLLLPLLLVLTLETRGWRTELESAKSCRRDIYLYLFARILIRKRQIVVKF